MKSRKDCRVFRDFQSVIRMNKVNWGANCLFHQEQAMNCSHERQVRAAIFRYGVSFHTYK